MIKKHLRVLILTSVIILLPILAGLILWDKLPDQIPSHWNISGEVDGWSSKTMAVLGMPLILLALHWFSVFATQDCRIHPESDIIYHFSVWANTICRSSTHYPYTRYNKPPSYQPIVFPTNCRLKESPFFLLPDPIEGIACRYRCIRIFRLRRPYNGF